MAWQGFHDGENKEGSGLDVVGELARPQTVQGGPYDVLLITEQHGLLETLIWNDTVRYLRNYHDRFIDGNQAGTTYFYESWMGINDKQDPTRWIAYERAASRIWQCMATRANVSLAHEGRTDRIVSLPAGLALAELIEKSTRDSNEANGLQGVSVDSLLADNVHLQPVGVYYLALVTYASVFHRSPVGAWKPAEISDGQAAALQHFAGEFVAKYYQEYRPLSLAQCQQQLVDGGIATYWSYIRDANWRPQMGSLRAYGRWARMMVMSRYLLTRTDHRNPFYFDAKTDREYWLNP